jgi:hypothetical protein
MLVHDVTSGCSGLDVKVLPKFYYNAHVKLNQLACQLRRSSEAIKRDYEGEVLLLTMPYVPFVNNVADNFYP